MIGRVEDVKALLDIEISNKLHGGRTVVTSWIDTAFDGHLVLSLQMIKDLELDSWGETEAILADGSRITLETFICYLNWFGDQIPLQVIANDGRFPLLGTGLLESRILHIDYRMKTVILE